MADSVILRIPEEESELADLLRNSPDLDAVEITGAGMDGGGEWAVLLVTLTQIAAKTILAILKNNQERAKNVKIEMDGMVFSGASLDEVSEFLKKHTPRRGKK